MLNVVKFMDAIVKGQDATDLYRAAKESIYRRYAKAFKNPLCCAVPDDILWEIATLMLQWRWYKDDFYPWEKAASIDRMARRAMSNAQVKNSSVVYNRLSPQGNKNVLYHVSVERLDVDDKFVCTINTDQVNDQIVLDKIRDIMTEEWYEYDFLVNNCILSTDKDKSAKAAKKKHITQDALYRRVVAFKKRFKELYTMITRTNI